MHYRLFVPKQAVGADLLYFDLFNASGSGHTVQLLSVEPVVSGAVAVVGAVGIDLFLNRTSAAGTGGTAATLNGTDKTACTISGLDALGAISSSITARITPTGGATAGAIMGWTCVFGEETNSAAYTPSRDLVTVPITVYQGTGISVIQGATAATGNVGFNVLFKLLPKA